MQGSDDTMSQIQEALRFSSELLAESAKLISQSTPPAPDETPETDKSLDEIVARLDEHSAAIAFVADQFASRRRLNDSPTDTS